MEIAKMMITSYKCRSTHFACVMYYRWGNLDKWSRQMVSSWDCGFSCLVYVTCSRYNDTPLLSESFLITSFPWSRDCRPSNRIRIHICHFPQVADIGRYPKMSFKCPRSSYFTRRDLAFGLDSQKLHEVKLLTPVVGGVIISSETLSLTTWSQMQRGISGSVSSWQ